MEEAELLADTVAIISKGRIVATDSPARLTEKHATHMRLTLGSSDSAAAGLIRKMGFDPTHTSDESICVRVNNADDVRAILGEFERAGLSLRGMDVRKPNLEEVFLKLTDEHHSGAANEGSK
jgi:ABC-2 type transport system ATP-binding protein